MSGTTFIAIPFSDGLSPMQYPTNTTPPPGPKSSWGLTWDFFDPCDGRPGGNKKYDTWMVKLAAVVVEHLAVDGSELVRKGKFALNGFPAHYKLFEHNKGKPNQQPRHDAYLYGHPSGYKYRSLPEFAPHVVWLASQTPELFEGTELEFDHKKAATHANCICVACGGGKEKRTIHPPKIGQSSAVKFKKTSKDGVNMSMGVGKLDSEVDIKSQVAKDEQARDMNACGWEFRTGELVWVNANALSFKEKEDNQDFREGWIPAIIVGLPKKYVDLRPERKDYQGLTKGKGKANGNSNAAGGFDGFDISAIEEDNTPTWAAKEEEETSYTVQLCSPIQGGLHNNVKQWELMPWLARDPQSTGNLSERVAGMVQYAGRVASTVSFFDPIREESVNSSDISSLGPHSFEGDINGRNGLVKISWRGVFLGSEKCYLKSPLRIKPPEGNTIKGEFDVLVVNKVLSFTQRLKAQPRDENKNSNRDDKYDNMKSYRTECWIEGDVYTTIDDEDSARMNGLPMIGPEEFQILPACMRTQSAPDAKGDVTTLKWARRHPQSEKGRVAVASIWGRWYPPTALQAWGELQCQPSGVSLRIHTLNQYAVARKDALGWKSFAGVELDRIDRKAEAKIAAQQQLGDPGDWLFGSRCDGDGGDGDDGDDDDRKVNATTKTLGISVKDTLATGPLISLSSPGKKSLPIALSNSPVNSKPLVTGFNPVNASPSGRGSMMLAAREADQESVESTGESSDPFGGGGKLLNLPKVYHKLSESPTKRRKVGPS